MRRRKSFVPLLLMFFSFVVGGGILFIATNGDLSVDDSSALYGGRIETGYPSAGFLIADMKGGGGKSCGFAVISNQVAITAGHCVDDTTAIRIGVGDFTSNYAILKKVDRATSKSGWVESKSRNEDFSVLTFQNDGYFNNFAKIGTPEEGCIARVVAYGRTENPLDSITHPRKSALLCISEIGPDLFKLTTKDAGICFGDSGSPVYREGTNEVIGIVVSIIKKNEADTAPCALGNTAFAVRVDANERLIRERVQADFAGSGVLPFPDQTLIEVSQTTLLEKLGLSGVQNFFASMTTRQRDSYLLIGAIAMVVMMILTIIYLLLKEGRKDVQYSSAYQQDKFY